MKTWILVWFLISPADEAGNITWEHVQTKDLTQTECFEQLVEKDVELSTLAGAGTILGHEIYCKDTRGKPVPIEQR